MHIQISICTCLYVHKHIHTDIISGAWCSSARWTGAERCCCTQIYACPRVCGCVHARTHAHTHTHTHTHTTTHALILSPAKGQEAKGEASAAAIDTGSHGYTHAPEAASAAKGGRPAAGPPGGAAGA